MIDAIIYYRSRPSEPEASELALRLQREAVRAEANSRRLRVLAQFVEEEGEVSDQNLRERRHAFPQACKADEPRPGNDTPDKTRPALFAALRADRTHEGAWLVIVSSAAIWSGEVFETPEVEPSLGPLYLDLSTALVPTPADIPVPAGAPRPLCLFADFRPRQLETPIYLCNAGEEPLSALTVNLDNISLFEFCREQSEKRWADASTAHEQRWDLLPADRAVLIDTLDHVMWDFVNRYRIHYSDAAGRRWEAEADNRGLNAERLAQEPTRVWEEVAQRLSDRYANAR